MSDLWAWRDEWVLELRGGRPNEESIKVYERSVRQFLTWLEEAHPEVTEPAQLEGGKHFRDWMIHLDEVRSMAKATRRVRGIAVGKFLQYLADEPDSGLRTNPAAGFALPVPDEPVVPVLADEDLAAILATAKGTTFIDRRDTVIMRLLLDCGLRREEVAQLNVDDVDLRAQEVLVHGKGSKDRLCPFGDRTALAIRKYIRVRAGRAAGASKPLLLSTRPKKDGTWRLTGGAIGEMVDRRCVVAGLPHIWPHVFRHTWAADFLGADGQEGNLERLGGWARGSLMVRRYGNATADLRARDAARRMARGNRV
jgi:site-specific recombinase XerD